MDPTTVILILLSILAGGGASKATIDAVRRLRRRRLEEGLRREKRHDDHRLSVFDVFWDLGASDFALELMRHDQLLPARAGDVEEVHRRLEAVIDSHGSYQQFVDDSLEAIREFYRAGADAPNRREVPTLETRARKLLPVGEQESDTSSSIEVSALVPRDGGELREGADQRLGHFADRSLDEKRRLQKSDRVPGVQAEGRVSSPGSVVDVDDVADFDPGELLTSVVEGRFTETIEEWWEGRKLRGLKNELDRAFEDLYDFYVEQVDRTPDFYDNLFDIADRWEEEADRIREVREQAPLEGHPSETAADVLLEMAEKTARSIARRSERQTTDAIERIHDAAREGDFAMAGYLVYLNHHAFFAGRSPEYGKYVRRIENTAHQVKQEIRRREQ
jgi:hypothetical protein